MIKAAAADAVLDIFEKRHIVDHVKEIGAYLYEKLEGLKDKYDVVKDHRGTGLIQGLEFTVSVGPIVSKALLEMKWLRDWKQLLRNSYN